MLFYHAQHVMQEQGQEEEPHSTSLSPTGSDQRWAVLLRTDQFWSECLQSGRSLLSSTSSCGFRRIPSGKLEFHGIPWNFCGKHLAGASAIWVSISMEIPTFFQGIPMEMVRIQEPPGMIPNGIHGIPLEFRWNSMGNSLIVIVKNSSIVKNQTLASVIHHVSERKSILAVALYDC